MKEAKGNPDVVDAVGAIQQLILKPEWKSLVQDVLENEQLTEQTQESIIAVANAIVTPLSLLVFAAELPQERVDVVKTLWKDTLEHICGKCDGGNQIMDTADEGQEQDLGAKRKLSFQKDEEDIQNSGLDDAFVEKLPESDPEHESSAEMNKVAPAEQTDLAEKESHDAPPPLESEKASKSQVKGLKSQQILARNAAKKGLVTGKTFHERTRSTKTVLHYG